MNRRQLRARIVLDEARALGLDLADLIAADAAGAELPTVSSYIDEIAQTFTAATATTYRPYWRLTAAKLGDCRLAEITIVDLIAVVDEAALRATRNRPASTGRSSRETCVAALRALFSRAVAAGLITVNPAAALAKPRRCPQPPPCPRRPRARPTARRSAHHQQRPRPRPARDPLPPRNRRPPRRCAQPAPPRPRPRPGHRVAPRERRQRKRTARFAVAARIAATPRRHPRLPAPRRPGLVHPQRRPHDRAPATTPSSTAPAPASPGPTAHLSPPTSCATPPSPPSAGSPATQWPRPSLATLHPRSPAATSTPPSPRSPRPSPPSPAKPTRSLIARTDSAEPSSHPPATADEEYARTRGWSSPELRSRSTFNPTPAGGPVPSRVNDHHRTRSRCVGGSQRPSVDIGDRWEGGRPKRRVQFRPHRQPLGCRRRWTARSPRAVEVKESTQDGVAPFGQVTEFAECSLDEKPRFWHLAFLDEEPEPV